MGISPVGARDPEFRSDLLKNRTTQLLSSAKHWMTNPFGCKNHGKSTPTDPFEHHLFCGSYVGILIVEFQSMNPGQAAIASWIRHVQGFELKEMPRKLRVTVPPPDEKKQEAFQTSAEILARMLAGEESLFPAIARLIQLPAPEALLRKSPGLLCRSSPPST